MQILNPKPKQSIIIMVICAGLLKAEPAQSAPELLANKGAIFAPYSAIEQDEFAEATDIEELLETRRYQIEMIIFSRSNGDLLGEEPLISTTPRLLPENMLALLPTYENTLLIADENRNLCIGYPNLSREPALPAKLAAILSGENEPELLANYHPVSSAEIKHRVNGTANEIQGSTDPLPEFFQDIGFNPSSKISDLGEPDEFSRQSPNALADQKLKDERPNGSAEEEIPVPTNAPKVLETPYLDFISELHKFERELKLTSYSGLSTTSLELGSEASALERDDGFRLLLHTRWQQIVPPRAAPQNIYVEGSTGKDSLQGLINVTLGRYLHFSGRLWLSARQEDFAIEQNFAPRQTPIFRPEPDNGFEISEMTQGLETLERSQSEWLSAYFQLNESRRMRSNEIHYLDHPAMGVIVKITPLEAPESLKQAWVEYDEYRQPDGGAPQ